MPFFFTFGFINSPRSFFFASRYFSLLVFPCFHSFHSSCFSQTPLFASPFDHHVCLCFAGSFVHPKHMPIASTKIPFKMFQKSSPEASFWLLSPYLLSMTWNYSLRCLHVVSITSSCVEIFSWYILLSLSQNRIPMGYAEWL